MAIVYPTRDEKGKDGLVFVGRWNCQSKGFALLEKQGSNRGWRHVRRAARDDKEDVPAAFFFPFFVFFPIWPDFPMLRVD